MNQVPQRAWQKLAIVGPGLIGGSIGLAALARGVAQEVVGIGRNPTSLREALRRKAITHESLDIASGASDADLVIVCTPVDEIPRGVEQAAAVAAPRALISDAGSTKGGIVKKVAAARAAGAWRSTARFLGGHPLAGSDKRGVEFASGDLFSGRVTVLTPLADTPPEDVAELRDFWTALGARVVEMSPEEHDQAVAVTSHLPHLLAAAIAGSTPERYVTLTAGGWLDTTRIAAADPGLWRQIFLANREHVLASLGRLERTLGELRRALEAGDGATLERLLAESKRIRDAVGS
jgi:prephenate dehydrogenase